MKNELCTNMQWNFQSLLPSDSQGFLTNSQLFPGTRMKQYKECYRKSGNTASNNFN